MIHPTKNISPQSKPTIILAVMYCAVVYFAVNVLLNLKSYGVGVDEALWIDLVRNPLKNDLILGDGYGGSLLAFLARPFALFSTNLSLALRYTGFVLGLGTLFMSYQLGKTLFDTRVGALAVILLATDHNFIICSRTAPWGEVIVQVFLSVTWMLLFIKGIHNRKRLLLFASGLAAGMAIWAKLMALGPIIGATAGIAVTTLFYTTQTKAHLVFLKSSVLSCLGGFLTGLMPVFYSTIQQMPNSTLIRCIQKAWYSHQTSGWDNFAFIHNLGARTCHLFRYLSFESSFALTDYLNAMAFPVFLVFALACLLVYLVVLPPNPKIPKNRLCFMLTTIIVLFASTCFSPSAVKPNHMQILFPFVQLAMGAFWIIFYDYATSKKLFAATAGVFLLVYVTFSAVITFHYHRLLTEHTVTCDFHISTALKQSAKFLNSNDLLDNPVIISTRGLKLLAFYDEQTNTYPSLLLRNTKVYPVKMPRSANKPFYLVIIDTPHGYLPKISNCIPAGYSAEHLKDIKDIHFDYKIFFVWKTALADSDLSRTQPEQTSLEKVLMIKKSIEREKQETLQIPQDTRLYEPTQR